MATNTLDLYFSALTPLKVVHLPPSGEYQVVGKNADFGAYGGY
jgi:hypothetical protein